MADELEAVFGELRQRILSVSGGMQVARDDPGHLILKTGWNEPGKDEPAWFAAVQLRKNYVSCHLMPLYALPALREAVPAELLKRMQGKSCFNFKKVDPDLFDVLARVASDCAAAYATPVLAHPH